MTAVITAADNPSPGAMAAPTSPKKRRRRAPTSGAADDCFACRDLHTPCDRRRPYCTQCLDRGKDCSGYKTTLTWGVGVASRGKLRGLSLPIAKSKKVDPVEKSNGKHGGADSSVKLATSDKPQSANASGSFISQSASVAAPQRMTFGFVNVDPNAPPSSHAAPQPTAQWSPSNATNRANNTRNAPRTNLKRAVRRHSLQPLHVPNMSLNFHQAPMSAHMFGNYEGAHFENAAGISPMSTTFQLPDSPLATKKYTEDKTIVPSPAQEAFYPASDPIPWSVGKMSPGLSSLPTSQEFRNGETFYAESVVSNTLDYLFGMPEVAILNVQEPEEHKIKSEHGEDGGLICSNVSSEGSLCNGEVDMSLSLSKAIPTLSIGSTPELRYLINYYDKVISPVIVAFDGPSNPYRTHILRLASQSETLQHAIAALSASNLRMRREHNPSVAEKRRLFLTNTPHAETVRRSSMAHSMLNDDHHQSSFLKTDPGVPSQRELLHKGKSIQALNAQLADQSRRKDDTVLATLLMLCLYHICDTGVAKFKTQFAGVKKILTFRGETGSNSKETKWLTTMFMWFDAMTATVNDREGQFHGDIWSTNDFEREDWALENLAGCDGRLFDTISKLGRLNLLSQGKSVGGGGSHGSVNHLPQRPSKSQEFYRMHSNCLDGNGWTAMGPERYAKSDSTDSRTQFWDEWMDIRKRLQEWELDTSCLPAPMCESSLDVNRIDLRHISESFRYSALLYTERLAYPHLPSSTSNFQDLIAHAIYHITNVKSDVYLLWPLFITGTECVDDVHRDIIRERCWEIQKDSGFFNNISGLELLEKIWRDKPRDDAEVVSGGDKGEVGFMWRKAMAGVDGEYIVI